MRWQTPSNDDYQVAILMRFSQKVLRRITRGLVDMGVIPPFKNPGVRIIYYHGIDKTGCRKYNLRFISQAQLEGQIIAFKEIFHIAKLEEIFAGNYPKDQFVLAITFDDGMENNFKYALPILEKHQVPATFFATGLNQAGEDIIWYDYLCIASTLIDEDIELEGKRFIKNASKGFYIDAENRQQLIDYIQERGSNETKRNLVHTLSKQVPAFKDNEGLFDYWKLMTDEQISAISRSPLFEIGAHGYGHNELGNIPHEDAMQEIAKGKSYLENLTQKPVQSLAYPVGSYTRKMIDDSFSMGLTKQLAVRYLFPEDREDPRILDRYGMWPQEISLRYLNYIIANS